MHGARPLLPGGGSPLHRRHLYEMTNATRRTVGLSCGGNQPTDAVLVGDTLYWTESGNHAVRMANIQTRLVSTLTGNGQAGFRDGPFSTAQFKQPAGMAWCPLTGFIYVAETGNRRVRRLSLNARNVKTVAGSDANDEYNGDGGPALSAPLRNPARVAVDCAGNLWVSEFEGHRIRRVDAGSQMISTWVGTGSATWGGEGGTSSVTTVRNPAGMALRGTTLFFADSGNGRIRRVDNVLTGWEGCPPAPSA